MEAAVLHRRRECPLQSHLASSVYRLEDCVLELNSAIADNVTDNRT